METDNSVKAFKKLKQVKEKRSETKNEELANETILNEEQNLLSEEQKTEIIVEKRSEISNDQQDENKDVLPNITIQYQKIIEQALIVKFKIKYTEIQKLIKHKIGKEIDKDFAIKITEQMSNVEKVKIGDVKKINGIQKVTTRSLFNE